MLSVSTAPRLAPVPCATEQADVEARAFVASWQAGVGEVCGEPVFVPSPPQPPAAAGGGDSGEARVAPAAEDEGVVLCLVTGAASYVAVLDAGGLGELARLPLPGHAPLGFHGNFYAAPGGG